MQIKTIQKIISSKMEDWLKSITDENLVKMLKKDIIVTGGCIPSLLLKEKVNDFDVYIASRSTLEAVIKYYASKYTLLVYEKKDEYISQIEDVEHFSQRHPLDYEKIMNAFAISVRTLKEGQIKLFFDGRAGIKSELVDDGNKYKVAYLSPNAISLTDDIQIIIRFYGEPSEIHKNYDFVHATNYFTFNEGLVLNQDALVSILTKQLKYTGSLYPVTSVLRLKKFIKRNWNITSGEILKIIFQCSQLDLTNVDVLEEQLIGMDVAYFSALIEIIRNIDSNTTITSEYLFTIIDRVFNLDDAEE